jgi:hypothetical protein
VLIPLAGLLALLAPDATAPADICELGRVIVHDLPPAVPDPVNVGYYVDGSSSRSGLLALCPNLREKLPAGYSIADYSAWARANNHAPLPGRSTAPAIIYTVGAPKLAADARSATVDMTVTCTGLCGQGLVAFYIRTRDGWRRNGQPHTKWVS